MLEEKDENGFSIQDTAHAGQALRWIVDGLKPLEQLDEHRAGYPEVFGPDEDGGIPLKKYQEASIELLRSLVSGRLKAYGHCYEINRKECVEIPSNLWSIYYDWEDNGLQSENGFLAVPIFDTEDLIKVFPFNLTSDIADVTNEKDRSNRGRPRKAEKEVWMKVLLQLLFTKTIDVSDKKSSIAMFLVEKLKKEHNIEVSEATVIRDWLKEVTK